MKKYFATTLISTILLSSAANATNYGIYMGLDAIWSRASFKYNNKLNIPQGIKTEKTNTADDGAGVGVVLGYKGYMGTSAFLAPELFYDYLNIEAKDYYHSTLPKYAKDTIALRSRYGAKLNLGYDFTNFFSGYLTYGISNLDYVNRFPSTGESEGKSKATPIYGLGIALKFSDKWALKAEYNEQSLSARYSIDGVGVNSKIKLATTKVGLLYNF